MEPNIPPYKLLEEALIAAGIAQSDREYLGGKVAFVRSPRMDIATLFSEIEQGKYKSGRSFGVPLEELFEQWPAFNDIREDVCRAVAIARSMGWDEYRNHFYRMSYEETQDVRRRSARKD